MTTRKRAASKSEPLEVNLPALKQMLRQMNAIAQMRQALHDALPNGWESYPHAAEVDALLAEAGMFEDE